MINKECCEEIEGDSLYFCGKAWRIDAKDFFWTENADIQGGFKKVIREHFKML